MKDEHLRLVYCCSLTFTLFVKLSSSPLVTLLVHVYLHGVVVNGVWATCFHHSLVLLNCHRFIVVASLIVYALSSTIGGVVLSSLVINIGVV